MHPEILSITLFGIVAAFTPGPNNFVAFYSGFNFGIKKTMPHIMGVTLGFPFLLLCLALGLINIFKSIYFNADASSFLIGDGPGTLLGIQDVRYNDIAARYMVSTLGLGVNGWSTALISLGFIGAITITSIYFYILTVSYKQTKIEITPYWKAICFGTFLISTIFFMDFFTYSRSFYHTIPLNIILFYLIGIIERRRYNH